MISSYILMHNFAFAWFQLVWHADSVPLQVEKFLLEKLDLYESAVGDSNVKGVPRIEAFPPAFQSIPRNPIVLDLAYNCIEFPSLESRMKKDRKGFISRLWRWVSFVRFWFIAPSGNTNYSWWKRSEIRLP